MPTRRYLQDFDKDLLSELELFLAEQEFSCPESHEVEVGNDLPPERTIETDLVLVEVIHAPESEMRAFDVVVFSDVHSCTPVGDAQQYTGIRMISFTECDDPECGGPGGWIAVWSNAP